MVPFPGATSAFNPIEMAFSKLKSLMRSRAECTGAALWDAVGDVLEAFTPAQWANFFTTAGYEPD
ncbi:transposase [Acidomonas methanolica]|uniref:Transposase n=1 Tax=Acidomonas methanolica NBRC 104435 TaxID=1231351 RepID=A0A023D957_ACIMT|nr:transposase [Acidomonas methanolica NBRC 104435]GBQ49721.1 transposase [Acidomonas methanolica]